MNLSIMLAAAIATGVVADAPARESAAAGHGAPLVERARYLMGTVCRISALAEGPVDAADAVEKAFDEIARIESILSDYDPASELSVLNRAGRGTHHVSIDLASFFESSLAISEETAGAFDVTVGPLVDLYALRSGGRWPSPDEVRLALRRCGFRKVALEGKRGEVRFVEDGMKLDPGAIGKGIALDAAARFLRDAGVRDALLDFGGQVLAVGAGAGGCGFPVDVATTGRDRLLDRPLFLADASVSTSANDERGLVVDGRPLGHILDPRTGRPASAAVSVTVVAPSATRADALSTALFVMGPDAALEAAGRLGVEALFVVETDGSPNIRATPRFMELHRGPCAGPAPAAPASSPWKGRRT
jgi:thiamine biosynthesis lipoprotein